MPVNFSMFSVRCLFKQDTHQLTKSSIKRAAIKGNSIPSFLITSRNHMKSKNEKKQRFVIIYHVWLPCFHIFLTYERHQETHQSHFHFGLASLVCSTHPEKITSGSSQVGENTYYAWSHQIKLLLKPPVFFVLEMAGCVFFSELAEVSERCPHQSAGFQDQIYLGVGVNQQNLHR